MVCQYCLSAHCRLPIATVGALILGLVNFKRGNMAQSHLAMRLRVVAQGGTVIALLVGVMYSSMGTGKEGQSKLHFT